MALSNSQFDAIMRVYNQRQFLNKRRQDERIREVYERIPQVEALTDEIAAAMALSLIHICFICPVPVGASLEEMAEGRPGGDRGLCLYR